MTQATQKISARSLHFAAPFALGDAGTPTERQFSGIAYSGGAITDHWAWENVVFDLSTTKAAKDRLPCLFAHNDYSPIGVAEQVVIGNDIQVSGYLFDDADGRKVTDKRGMPWEMSIYIKPKTIEEIPSGQSVTVNGQQFSGPIKVFRDNTIREVTICTLGADSQTSAQTFKDASDEITVILRGAAMADPVKDTSAIDALTAQVAALTTENTALKAKFSEARKVSVKALFSELGREHTDASAALYESMTDEQFSAVSADLRKAKPKPDAHLFREQATDGSGMKTSGLVADAAARK